MKMSRFFGMLLVFLLLCNLCYTQETVSEKENLENIRNAIELRDDRKHPKTIELLTKASIQAKENEWNNQLWYVYNAIALTYSDLSNYGEALTYYNQALEVLQEDKKLQKNQAIVFSNIGNLYQKEQDYTNALRYYEKAFAVTEAFEPDHFRKAIGVNIADLNNELKNTTEAKKALQKVNYKTRNNRIDQAWKITRAEVLFTEGRVEEARKITENLFPKTDKLNDGECYGCIVELLAEIYAAQNNPDQSIYYAKKGLAHTHELKNKIDLYAKLANYYTQKNDLITSLQYKDSVIEAKDSLSRLVNRQLYETNKVKLKVQDYQAELVLNKKQQEAERNIFIIVIVFGLAVFYFIYRMLRNKVIRQRQEKTIAESNFNLKLEKLKNNIGLKNRKLSAKALYFSKRNELLEEVLQSLVNIPEITGNKEALDYIRRLKRHLKTDEEWDEFIKHFEEINPRFFKALKEKHTELTDKDMRFLSYIYMNLDTNEICAVFNITANACRKRKRRLMQKMGLKEDVSLYEYLLKIA